VISGFAPGDTIDLAGIPFNSQGAATFFETGQAPLTNYVLQVVEGGSTYELQLDKSQPFGGAFVLSADPSPSGGTDITMVSGATSYDTPTGTTITTITGAVTNHSTSATPSNLAVSPYTGVVEITDSLGGGTGFIIGPDEILTAAHVVATRPNLSSQIQYATNIEI
jgi:hypothetical protein